METIYTLEEAAGILKVSNWLMYQLVRSNEIRYFRVGNRIRFRESVLIEYMKTHEKMGGH